MANLIPSSKESLTPTRAQLEVQIRALVVRVKTGDSRAFEELADQFKPLITKLINKYFSYDTPQDKEDVRQELLMKLHETVNFFDPESGNAFMTPLLPILKNHCLKIIRGRNAGMRRADNQSVSMDEILGHEGDEITFHDLLPSNTVETSEAILDSQIARQRAEKYICSLSPRDSQMARMYFLEGKTQLEIAEQFGITDARVSQILRPIRKRLASLLSGYTR